MSIFFSNQNLGHYFSTKQNDPLPRSSCSNSLSCAVCVGEASISIFCFSFLHSSFQLFKKKICGKGFCIVHTYMKVFLAYFVTILSLNLPTLTRQKIVLKSSNSTIFHFTFNTKPKFVVYEILTKVGSILQHTKLLKKNYCNILKNNNFFKPSIL